MKRLAAFALILVCVFGLASCSSQAGCSSQESDTRPMITMYGKNYIAPYMPVDKLPDEYEYIGELSEDAANDTGLAGCKMYVVAEKDSLLDFYLYQECGTPISIDTVDNTQRQMAYVQWVLTE